MLSDNLLGNFPTKFMEQLTRKFNQNSISGSFCLNWMFNYNFLN